jgi:hypothetical protein
MRLESKFGVGKHKTPVIFFLTHELLEEIAENIKSTWLYVVWWYIYKLVVEGLFGKIYAVLPAEDKK